MPMRLSSHGVTSRNLSPNWRANSVRAGCQNAGGRTHFRATFRSAR